MRAYQKERFLNAVCFFASQHSRRTGQTAFQTYIYKYLALFDFAMLEQDGQPALDIDYKAFERGPVPDDLYSDKQDTSHYQFMKVAGRDGEPLYVINPLVEPDLSYFSAEEISVMEGILAEFAHPGVTTQELIDATHARIIAWKKAWDRRGVHKSMPMAYDDTFDPDAPTESSERYFLIKAFKNGPRRSNTLAALRS